MTAPITDTAEWLEADGLGGFASGTTGLVRTRRYHALLLAATTPPTGRVVLVNGFEALVTTAAGRFPLSSQRYAPDVVFPDGVSRIEAFTAEPWPRWTFALADGMRVSQEVLAVHGRPLVVVRWRLLPAAANAATAPLVGQGVSPAGPQALLDVRPLLSGRDYHALHRENGSFRFDTAVAAAGALEWHPYDGVPPVRSGSNGSYRPDPLWYRSFLYTAEQERGLDCVEDLASPGLLSWDLSEGDAVWMLSTERLEPAADMARLADDLCDAERTRRIAFGSPLHRAADAYIVSRGAGQTIIAGYPWFTDWGRDTFIALPGLCLATGRINDAVEILRAWADTVSEGMLPNRFPDAGGEPEFNAVDASLWYVNAVRETLDEAARRGIDVHAGDRAALTRAVTCILEGYRDGTRHGIRMDDDGLVAAGAPGVQLTWMDARVGDRVITPRIGKPVEVQALWINALAFAATLDSTWDGLRRRATGSFERRFWNEGRGCLYDVIDADHVPGRVDAALRPNQVLALGGLPLCLLPTDRAARVLLALREALLVPLGLRTLAPAAPGYIGRYGGGVAARDGAYHQGTAWPWLLYAYGEACCRVDPEGAPTMLRALIEPIAQHLSEAGLGHVSEVVSGDAPHTPGGCPFQAWSLAALLRLHALARAAPAVAAV